MTNNDTIAAISTAQGPGAIAVVRMSGPLSFDIATKIFSKAQSLESHKVRFGHIVDEGVCIDEAILIPYKAPATYTGEDLIEINCHGGHLIPQEVLALCLKHGARLAQAGEFTKRAFLNGRMDLTQAEAVLDLIQAKTHKQGRLALSALRGNLGNKILALRHNLLELLTRVVAGIDFPEEVGEIDITDAKNVVEQTKQGLAKLARTSQSGRFLREGLRLAIVGRPNAGKSSLLNQLLSYERAIVTDIPGTTRDSIEELVDINGIPVVLIDTAGIRKTEDTVEKIGIERSRNSIDNADLVLLVCDLSQPFDDSEERILEFASKKPLMVALNKQDLVATADLNQLLSNFDSSLSSNTTGSLVFRGSLSAKTGDGLEPLLKAIETFAFTNMAGEVEATLNVRQSSLCNRAIDSLTLVEETIKAGMPQDCLATDLKSSINCLSEICGEAIQEEIITEVFANFCIGK